MAGFHPEIIFCPWFAGRLDFQIALNGAVFLCYFPSGNYLNNQFARETNVSALCEDVLKAWRFAV